jgi:hypothetical protein
MRYTRMDDNNGGSDFVILALLLQHTARRQATGTVIRVGRPMRKME